jgi:hypothetical protein
MRLNAAGEVKEHVGGEYHAFYVRLDFGVGEFFDTRLMTKAEAEKLLRSLGGESR